jgi:hypothetical protein
LSAAVIDSSLLLINVFLVASCQCFNSTMSHQDQNYDIFAISTPTPEDERTIRLRKEVNNLSDRLSDLLRTAPATNSNTNFLETEDWCRKWTAVTVRDLLSVFSVIMKGIR